MAFYPWSSLSDLVGLFRRTVGAPHGPLWTSIPRSLPRFFLYAHPVVSLSHSFFLFPWAHVLLRGLIKINATTPIFHQTHACVCVFVRVHECLFGLGMGTDLLPGDREIKFTKEPLWKVEQSYVTNPFRFPHSFNLPQEWPLLTCHAKNKNFRTHSSNVTWNTVEEVNVRGTFCVYKTPEMSSEGRDYSKQTAPLWLLSSHSFSR